MKSRGRPRIMPVILRNGFYIEVCEKGMKRGMKIRSESRQAMEDAAGHYSAYKEVFILGEYKSGVPVPVSEVPVS